MEKVPLSEQTLLRWNAASNALSFAIAALGAETVFFFFLGRNEGMNVRSAFRVTGGITLVAFYLFDRFFYSWVEVFTFSSNEEFFMLCLRWAVFNNDYCYVTCLLTVPVFYLTNKLSAFKQYWTLRPLSWDLTKLLMITVFCLRSGYVMLFRCSYGLLPAGIIF